MSVMEVSCLVSLVWPRSTFTDSQVYHRSLKSLLLCWKMCSVVWLLPFMALFHKLTFFRPCLWGIPMVHSVCVINIKRAKVTSFKKGGKTRMAKSPTLNDNSGIKKKTQILVVINFNWLVLYCISYWKFSPAKFCVMAFFIYICWWMSLKTQTLVINIIRLRRGDNNTVLDSLSVWAHQDWCVLNS